MKIISLILIFFITSCGYNPIYQNKNFENFQYQEISYDGDEDTNIKIIRTLNIIENSNSKNKLFISSSYTVDEISKNSKGEVELYNTALVVILELKDSNNKRINFKNISKEFSYSNKTNKYDLVEYQKLVKNNLLDSIIYEINLFLNSS
jgi:hypothetical protein